MKSEKLKKWLVIKDNFIITEGPTYWQALSLAKSNNGTVAKRFHGRIIRQESFELSQAI